MDRKQKFDQGDVHVMTTPDMLRLVDKIQAVCTLYCDKVALKKNLLQKMKGQGPRETIIGLEITDKPPICILAIDSGPYGTAFFGITREFPVGSRGRSVTNCAQTVVMQLTSELITTLPEARDVLATHSEPETSPIAPYWGYVRGAATGQGVTPRPGGAEIIALPLPPRRSPSG